VPCVATSLMTKPQAFVATSFEKGDREAVESFREAIEAGGFQPFIDKSGSPDNPPTKVRQSMVSSDCVILVMFRRDQLKKGGWKSSTWIANEAGMAWAYGKPILAFVEDGVKDLGILQSVDSYTVFDRKKLGTAEEANKIHAALVSLRERVGSAAQLEQLEWIDRVLTPMGKSLISKLSEQGNLYPTEDEGRFYDVAESIVKSSEKVRFATKTPVLLLPGELGTQSRRTYRDALMERLKGGTFEAKYMFSLSQTIAELQRYSSRTADEQEMAVTMLRSVQQAIDAGTLELRSAASDDFVSCIIGKSEMAYLWKSPQEGRSIATIYESRPLIVEQFQRFFDKAFAGAKRVRNAEIDEWVQMIRGLQPEETGPVP
jgi:hypothetical protein